MFVDVSASHGNALPLSGTELRRNPSHLGLRHDIVPLVAFTVSHLRRWTFLSTAYPGLPPWANLCRAYGARAVSISQRCIVIRIRLRQGDSQRQTASDFCALSELLLAPHDSIARTRTSCNKPAP